MHYLNTLFDAIEQQLSYEENIGQIASYGSHHYIEFIGSEDNKYTQAKAAEVQATINDVIASLNCENLAATEIIKISGTRYYKVKVSIIYSFDSTDISVCPACKKFFEASNPAQRYCFDEHYYKCKLCGKYFILPNYLTYEYLLNYKYESVEFNIDNISISIPNQYYTGLEIIPDIVVKYKNTALKLGVDYYIEYCTDNVEVGEATISLVGQWKYSGKILTKFYIIATDIANCQINDIAIQEYNEDGNYNPYVHLRIGSYDLVNGVDYNVALSENTITLTGIGDKFYGSRIEYFEILEVDENQVLSINSIPDQPYTGFEILPELTILYNGLVLIAEKDYSVVGHNNINVGVATLTITGTGRKVDWIGTCTVTFNIVSS